MDSITSIDGILVGHRTDKAARTGCTAVIFTDGAVAGVDVRGSAPGTRETDLLRGFNSVERINAILLSGGSAYGLDAASGVMKFLEEQGAGVNVGVGVVPIVCGAVIFDLAVGDPSVRPTADDGYYAAKSASALPVESGAVGAGTGATVGKLYGMEFAACGGLGSACVELAGGVKVGALFAVNSLGDVFDPATGRVVAGARRDGAFISETVGGASVSASFGNTTIGVVATNAALTREEAAKLASMAHDGLAQAIRPVHTSLDGDTVFCAATDEIKEYDMLSLQIAVPNVVAAAILDAVKGGGR